MSKRNAKPPAHLSEAAQTAWQETIDAHPKPDTIVGPELEAYANLIARGRNATRRIDSEGEVVADDKGRPIPHPALEIERRAQQDVKEWAKQFTPREADAGGIGFY